MDLSNFLARVLAQSYGFGFGSGCGADCGCCYKNRVKLCYRVMRKNENVTQDVTLENGLTMRVEGVL